MSRVIKNPLERKLKGTVAVQYLKSFAILALTVSVAFSFVACAKEPQEPAGKITMTTKASEVTISVAGAKDFTIDWGDGKKSNVNDAVVVDGTPDWFVFSHDYSGKSENNIVITGNVMMLYCGDNELTTLDVSRNTTLEDLTCNNNLLTSLIVSPIGKLNSVECVGNRLIASALNNLFISLPEKSETETGVIYMSWRSGGGNPGNSDCDRSIAEKRGWHFRSIK